MDRKCYTIKLFLNRWLHAWWLI